MFRHRRRDPNQFGVEAVSSTVLTEQWRVALSEPTAAVFFKTPSNPMMELVDIAAVSELHAHAVGATQVVDNAPGDGSFLLSLRHGADVSWSTRRPSTSTVREPSARRSRPRGPRTTSRARSRTSPPPVRRCPPSTPGSCSRVRRPSTCGSERMHENGKLTLARHLEAGAGGSVSCTAGLPPSHARPAPAADERRRHGHHDRAWPVAGGGLRLHQRAVVDILQQPPGDSKSSPPSGHDNPPGAWHHGRARHRHHRWHGALQRGPGGHQRPDRRRRPRPAAAEVTSAPWPTDRPIYRRTTVSPALDDLLDAALARCVTPDGLVVPAAGAALSRHGFRRLTAVSGSSSSRRRTCDVQTPSALLRQ